MTTIEKPWGREEIIHEEGKAKVKRLVVRMGERLSMQYHHDKREFLVCVKGEAIIEIQLNHKEKESLPLSPGDSFFINRKTIHRIVAETDCELVELACGSDEDIVRIADKYGRV